MGILYTPLNHADHAWLFAGDRALKIDEGIHADKVIKVTISRSDSDENQDGIIDQLNVKIQGELVDENTGDIIEVSSTQVKAPANVHSISTDALGEGSVSIPSWLASLTDDVVFKVLRHEAALLAWAQLPV